MAPFKQVIGVFANPIISGLIGGVVGAAVTIMTATLTYWSKGRELDIEMVRISLAILAGENKDTSLQGRRFALQALEKFSTVDIPDNDFDQWAKTGTVPVLTDVNAELTAKLKEIGRSIEEVAKPTTPDQMKVFMEMMMMMMKEMEDKPR